MSVYFKSKRAAAVLLTVLLILTGPRVLDARAGPDWPGGTGIMAEAGIAVDAGSGAVLFGQNIHLPYAPASITKLLTALVVAEHAGLDEKVTFSRDAVYNVESGSGNAVGLEEGDVLTVRDCLYALLLRSSNQAANALAEYVGGTRDGFVELMNEKAAELGCGESHFANPSGLNDESQYVTAYDMARIARAAFRNDVVLQISSAKSYKIASTLGNPDGVTLYAEHRLLKTTDPSSRYYLEGVVAGKTGYTSLAGNTLVTYAVRDGRGVISVVLKGSQPQYYLDGKALIEFGFSEFENIRVAEQETFLRERDSLKAPDGEYLASELYIEEDAVATVPHGGTFADLKRTVAEELPADAPETALALLEYSYNDRKVGSAYVCARNLHFSTEPVPVSILEQQENPEKDGETGGSLAGAVPLIAAGIVCLLLVLAAAFLLRRRQKKKREEAARRRRRRERLRELGYSDEEFDRLLEEKRNARGRGKKR